MAVLPSWYFDQLNTATWRSLDFVAETIQMRGGRKVELHQYLYYDYPWAEDLGRGGQEFQVSGWLIGDDIIQQFKDFNSACNDIVGPGYFVHPKLGSLWVSLLGYSTNEDVAGNMVALRLTFVVVSQSNQLAPYTAPATGIRAVIAAVQSVVAAIKNFASRALQLLLLANNIVQSAIGAVANLIGGVLSLTNGFVSAILSLGNDATMAFNAVSGLSSIIPTGYGVSRYNPPFTYAVPPALSNIDPSVGVTQVVSDGTASLLAAASTARANIASACAAVTAAAGALSATDSVAAETYANSVSNAVEQLRIAASNPNDSIRLLANLAGFNTYVPSASMIAAVIPNHITLQQTTCSLFRRIALSSLARAVSDFKPTSAGEAQSVLNAIIPLYDAEINIAGDTSDDTSFEALMSLKAAVVSDLQTRASSLPELVTVNQSVSLPACVIAEQLYGDGTRTAELIRRVNPTHPLFMPRTFEALSY